MKSIAFTSAKAAKLLPAPTDRPSKEYWHPEIVGFGVRVGKTRARDGYTKRQYIVRVGKTSLLTEKSDGKPVLGLVERDGQQEAITFEQALQKALTLQQAAKAKTTVVTRQTLGSVWLLVLEDWRKNPGAYSDEYIRKIKMHYKNYLSHFSSKFLDELDSRFWIELIESARDGYFQKYGQRLILREAASQQGLLNSINYLIKFATSRELIEGKSVEWRPTASARSALRAVNVRESSIDPAAIGAVWHASDALLPPGWRDLLRVGMLTGLRDSLLMNMRWSQIDFSTEVIKLGYLDKGTKRQAKAATPENLRNGLMLPLSSEVMRILRNRKRFEPVNNPNEFVWYNSAPIDDSYQEDNSKPVKRMSDPRKAWARLNRFAGFSVRKHDLRRTFASVGAEVMGPGSLHLSLLMLHTPSSVKGVSKVTAQYVLKQLRSMRMLTQNITDAVLELAGERAPNLTQGMVRLRVPDFIEAELLKESRTERLGYTDGDGLPDDHSSDYILGIED